MKNSHLDLPSHLPGQGGRMLPLDQALRRYWKNLIGVALFPPAVLMGGGFSKVPPLVLALLFFAVSFVAAWPYFTKRAPYMFWIVAMAVWMASAFASVGLLSILSFFGIRTEG